MKRHNSQRIKELRKKLNGYEADINEFLYVCPVDLDVLKEQNRLRELKEWRQIGMVWYALQTNSLSESARYFDRNHSTVLHSFSAVIDAIDGYCPDVLKKVREIMHFTESNIQVETNEIASAVLIERNLIEKFRKLAEL